MIEMSATWDNNEDWISSLLEKPSNRNESILTSLSYTSLFADLLFETPSSVTLSGATSMVTSPVIKAEAPEQVPVDMALDKPEKPKKKRAPRKRLTAHQKEAHNKIEKKYRININTKIANLQSIMPHVSKEKTAFKTEHNDSEGEGPVPRLNKSMILEKAIQYILELQKKERVALAKDQYFREKGYGGVLDMIEREVE